jgi:hypothetical protein
LTTAAQEPLCRLAMHDGSDGSTLVISGELCFSSADGIELELAAYEGWPFATIDLRGLRFVDLSGVEALRRVWSRPTRDGHLPVVIQAPCVRRLLGLLEMHEPRVAGVSVDAGRDDPPRDD